MKLQPSTQGKGLRNKSLVRMLQKITKTRDDPLSKGFFPGSRGGDRMVVFSDPEHLVFGCSHRRKSIQKYYIEGFSFSFSDRQLEVRFFLERKTDGHAGTKLGSLRRHIRILHKND